jgi:hypothetical protein
MCSFFEDTNNSIYHSTEPYMGYAEMDCSRNEYYSGTIDIYAGVAVCGTMSCAPTWQTDCDTEHGYALFTVDNPNSAPVCLDQAWAANTLQCTSTGGVPCGCPDAQNPLCP